MVTFVENGLPFSCSQDCNETLGSVSCTPLPINELVFHPKSRGPGGRFETNILGSALGVVAILLPESASQGVQPTCDNLRTKYPLLNC